nr:hypothetical protein CFP56_45691 [Quercus suber]
MIQAAVAALVTTPQFRLLMLFYTSPNPSQEACRLENEEVFMQEDKEPRASDEEVEDEARGWTKVIDVNKIEHTADEDKEEIVPDENYP